MEKGLCITDVLQTIIDDICNDYCKYAEMFTQGELSEDEVEKVCDDCPLMRI